MPIRRGLLVGIIVAIVAVALVVAGVWYATRPGPPAPAKPIKIGFFAPLTGFASADGYSALHAALLAVDDINAAGGINGRLVDLVYYDDRCSPDEAIAIAHRLIEEDKVVAAVSGSYSHPTLAASSIFQEAKIPLVSAYAVHPDITKDKPYVFRAGMSGEAEGASMGYVTVKNLGAKKIAYLVMDIPFGITLSENAKVQAEKMGAETVYYEKYELGEKEYGPWLTEIAKAEPDVIIATAYYAEAACICIQSRAMGIKVPILGCEGYDSPKFLELAGDAAEGVIFATDLDRDSESKLVKSFLDMYKKRCGIDADMVGASAYDAVRVLYYALDKGGTTPEAIKNALPGLKDFEGVTGTLKYFTEQGNICKPIVFQVVRAGAFHRYCIIEETEIITPPL